MSASENESVIARAPDDGECTRFQLETLYFLADEGATYGLGIKRGLEDYYGETVNHGRLYPNLRELEQRGLVNIGQLDARTNEYSLTDAGRELLRRDSQRRYRVADQMGGDD